MTVTPAFHDERGQVRKFGAEIGLDFAPQGVACAIRLPFAARVVAL